MSGNMRQAAGNLFSRSVRSTAAADVPLESVGPADILLKFYRKRPDGALGLVTGASRAEFGREASDG